MTIYTKSTLKDGSVIEYRSNPGAQPQLTKNGVSVSSTDAEYQTLKTIVESALK